jgi:hypothetical protein
MYRRWLILLLVPLLLGADWAAHPENRWVKQSPTRTLRTPDFSWEGSGDYDPVSKKWLHFGGHDGIPQGFHLFTYDLETHVWQQRFAPTSPPGVCCVDGSHVFDVAHGRYVYFPGGSLGHGYQYSRGVKLKSSAVWLYDPAANAWTNMRPPPYQRPFLKEDWIGGLNAGATYDARNELAVSFGGQGNSGGTNNLFFYDAYANALDRISAANPPSPRDGMGIVSDPKNECLVVFGGQYTNDSKTYLFRLRTGKWEAHDLDPHPPAKKGKTYATIPRMAYDAHNEICLCLVWDDATGNHETWTLDVATLQWTKMAPPVEPEPSMSRSRNLGFSLEHNVFILDTNPSATKGKGAQIWTYRYKKAPPDKRPVAPTNVEALTHAGNVTLTWSAVADAKEYHVYRAGTGQPWQLTFAKIGAAVGTTFEDKDVSTGQIYFYTVRAVAADGTQGRDSLRARTQPRVLLEPLVSVLAADKVEVSWNKHPSKDVVGYNVYRALVAVRTVKKGTPSAWKDNDPEYDGPLPVEVRNLIGIKKLNDKPLAGTVFTDQVNLAAAPDESGGYKFAVYAYIVRAVNALGVECGPSPYALTIPSSPANVFNRDKGAMAELKWDANPEKGIAGYHIYKLQGTWNIVRVTTEPIKGTSFTHKNGPTRYWVVPVDALGQEGEPSSPVWHQHSYKGFYKGEWHQ